MRKWVGKIFIRRENSYSMRPDMQHQVLDLLPRKKCIIKEKLTLFELLNGLISLKHHDVITVVENRPKCLIKIEQKLILYFW